jgi:hypothetical protein
MPVREESLPKKAPSFPKRLSKTKLSLDKLLVYLEMQTIYKPKMCDVPGFQERYDNILNCYRSFGEDAINFAHLKITENAMRNHTFNEYRLMNPKDIREIVRELTDLGCIVEGSKLVSTKLHDIMHYFMLENLRGYFDDLQKGLYELNDEHPVVLPDVEGVFFYDEDKERVIFYDEDEERVIFYNEDYDDNISELTI